MIGAQQNMKDDHKTALPTMFNIPYTRHDLYEELKNVQADWEQKTKKKKFAKYNVNTVIGLSLGYNPNLPTDSKALVAHLKRYILENHRQQLKDTFGNAKFKASTPIAKQIAEDVTADLIAPLTKSGKPDMRYKINKGKKPKKFKPKTRRTSVKAGKAKKPKKGNIKAKVIAANPGYKGGGAETGTGGQASTSTAADLARIKKYIQSRLPAEVRRNMGRPALINQTGRFSNSVELISLTESKNTLMAKYTYLLSPYETFENTGRRRWPLAYNPKPLIAKSIRNLAQGRINQKLTLRRV
jgi:hypothetical protein